MSVYPGNGDSLDQEDSIVAFELSHTGDEPDSDGLAEWDVILESWQESPDKAPPE